MKFKKLSMILLSFLLIASVISSMLYTDSSSTVSAAGSCEEGTPGADPSAPGAAGSYARSEKVGDTIFLGGRFMEAGLTKYGSFGSVVNAPAGFHPPAARTTLGFVYDRDGWDEGEDATAGDYFLPGTPWEGFVVGYKTGSAEGTATNLRNSEATSNKAIEAVSNENQSASGEVKAVTILEKTDTVNISQTTSFNELDKFMVIEIILKNISADTMYDVRYMRNVDIDIDKDMNGTFTTCNEALFNPDGTDDFAVATAMGPISKNKMSLIAADERARAAKQASRSDAYAAQNWALDGSTLLGKSESDSDIAVTFAVGDLAPGASETFYFAYSMDDDLSKSLGAIKTVLKSKRVRKAAESEALIVVNDVWKMEMERFKNSDGTKSDQVGFSSTKSLEAAERSQAAGLDTVTMEIPDKFDEVKDVLFKLPVQSLGTLADKGLSMSIVTANGGVSLPATAMKGLEGEPFFNFIPIKDQKTQSAVETRAKAQEVVQDVLGNGTANVVGRPMTIETNLPSNKVELMMPLKQSFLPADDAARKEFLRDLAIFIEHSDGERRLIRPEIILPEGGLATPDQIMFGSPKDIMLKVVISKFSTFTILNVSNFSDAIQHRGYIQGYADGTFRPQAAISRIEMATILSRLLRITINDVTNKHKDVANSIWGYNDVVKSSIRGIMLGYSDGNFKPFGTVSRAELAVIVSRVVNLNEVTQNPVLISDVKGHWAEDVMKKAVGGGYLTAEGGKSRPDAQATRLEVVMAMNKIADMVLIDRIKPTFKDVPDTHPAYKAIESANMNR
jgi:hypothetical protein